MPLAGLMAHLCGPLSAPREGVEEADTCGRNQQQRKDHIVHRAEVHLDYVSHDATGKGDEHVKAGGSSVRPSQLLPHIDTH